jgi:energy-coupling factor transporter ATP-binding protein EcfA2
MKIKTIELHNYKAFYGDKNVIEVDSKNLFIYGENGSGKSSLYYALKDFFQSSIEKINLDVVENIFVESNNKGKVLVKLTFNNEDNPNTESTIELSSAETPYGITDIRDANQMRSFLNYKHLLTIHNIKKEEEINLFNLLVKGVLKHFKIIGLDKTLGETWQDIENLLDRKTDKIYTISEKKRDLKNSLKKFNDAFKTLFILPTVTAPNPNYILDNINNILNNFYTDIKITLHFNSVSLDTKESKSKILKLLGNEVTITVEYGGKEIAKPHLFLNEARLSAIAIAIHLGMIKILPQLSKIKILFLDDLFIGLDLSNRMPLMQILEQEFSDYQIIISTYDKPWSEVAKFHFHDNSNWKCIDLLVRKNSSGYDQPLIRYDNDAKIGSHIDRFITIAKEYYQKGDNKAAGVYLRGAFEFILKRYCYNKIKVKFVLDISALSTDDFWTAIKDYKKVNNNNCNLSDKMIKDIELCRKFVLNPLCHQDQTKDEHSNEIDKTIKIIKQLKAELT